MDLKDVVIAVKEKTKEAELAYNAGHHDVAEKYLGEIRLTVEAYFDVPATPAGDVTGSAVSEKPDEVQKDTPAKALGAAAQSATPGAAAAAGKPLPASQIEKPNQ